ncbi:ectonucleotide pyrophosphatase/phosphodiesterase family member 1 isoform X1 [Platichthys flesus]|uniref:ectonucleotide pyrophosphatase/phosphodiesterase family member 1 isoform X1 n=1 Tax=Platichthys flesus TaxID=8260 RepID=UPI002DBF4A8C|nr:ectonucleotide pyrophosphatase/phosphodiesterase family member 1 isoform X1 [Platichthys flesus]
MEVSKGEESGNEARSTLFGPTEVESQSRSPGGCRGLSKRTKILIGVLLLGLLVLILALALSRKGSNNETADGTMWLHAFSDETTQQQCPPGFSKPPLILVSLDGFRAEYLTKQSSHLPVINKLRELGATTPYMRPVYPTKTFPNHYSIVTGLYPESHGIVDNKMYDVTHNAFFSLKSEEKSDPKWYQGEPIWITAMHQKLKTGTFFWPGSDVKINGSYPNFYKLYDRTISFEDRVGTLIEWLSLPEGKRPDLYTLYLEEPDASGHRYGPGSKEVTLALEHVDRILGIMMDALTEKNLHHCVNLMIMSDHGMEEASCDKAEFVSTYQENIDDFNVIQGPAARIRPARLPDDYFSFDYAGLVKNLSCRAANQSMRPYLKENLPKRMHFANNKRIERGHLYMKEGWQAARYMKELKYCTGGFHGSDNLFTNMQAIFIGFGPGFNSNTVVPPFENIELYNVMCDLLGIRPSPNNGTHGSLNHLLSRPSHLPVHPAQLSHETPCEASDPVPTDDLRCTCTSQTETQETDMNRLLMTTNSSTKVLLRRLHHPFGTPRVVQPDAAFCLLHQSDYLSGYSRDRLMPLWVSYTLQPLTTVRPLSPELEACVRADVRVPAADSQLCFPDREDPSLSYGLLHPPNLSSRGPESDSLLTTNMAPMFPAFKDVWRHFHDVLLPVFSQQLNGVNVVSGPIFDDDFDGNVDAFIRRSRNETLTPTHFFVILTSCVNSALSPSQCEGPLQTQSFILPHRPDHTESCANGSDMSWVEEWLRFHTARVRDIELLTGLSFYHDRLSVEETLQLKTFLHSA